MSFCRSFLGFAIVLSYFCEALITCDENNDNISNIPCVVTDHSHGRIWFLLECDINHSSNSIECSIPGIEGLFQLSWTHYRSAKQQINDLHLSHLRNIGTFQTKHRNQQGILYQSASTNNPLDLIPLTNITNIPRLLKTHTLRLFHEIVNREAEIQKILRYDRMLDKATQQFSGFLFNLQKFELFESMVSAISPIPSVSFDSTAYNMHNDCRDTTFYIMKNLREFHVFQGCVTRSFAEGSRLDFLFFEQYQFFFPFIGMFSHRECSRTADVYCLPPAQTQYIQGLLDNLNNSSHWLPSDIEYTNKCEYTKHGVYTVCRETTYLQCQHPNFDHNSSLDVFITDMKTSAYQTDTTELMESFLVHGVLFQVGSRYFCCRNQLLNPRPCGLDILNKTKTEIYTIIHEEMDSSMIICESPSIKSSFLFILHGIAHDWAFVDDEYGFQLPGVPVHFMDRYAQNRCLKWREALFHTPNDWYHGLLPGSSTHGCSSHIAEVPLSAELRQPAQIPNWNDIPNNMQSFAECVSITNSGICTLELASTHVAHCHTAVCKTRELITLNEGIFLPNSYVPVKLSFCDVLNSRYHTDYYNSDADIGTGFPLTVTETSAHLPISSLASQKCVEIEFVRPYDVDAGPAQVPHFECYVELNNDDNTAHLCLDKQHMTIQDENSGCEIHDISSMKPHISCPLSHGYQCLLFDWESPPSVMPCHLNNPLYVPVENSVFILRYGRIHQFYSHNQKELNIPLILESMRQTSYSVQQHHAATAFDLELTKTSLAYIMRICSMLKACNPSNLHMVDSIARTIIDYKTAETNCSAMVASYDGLVGIDDAVNFYHLYPELFIKEAWKLVTDTQEKQQTDANIMAVKEFYITVIIFVCTTVPVWLIYELSRRSPERAAARLSAQRCRAFSDKEIYSLSRQLVIERHDNSSADRFYKLSDVSHDKPSEESCRKVSNVSHDKPSEESCRKVSNVSHDKPSEESCRKVSNVSHDKPSEESCRKVSNVSHDKPSEESCRNSLL